MISSNPPPGAAQRPTHPPSIIQDKFQAFLHSASDAMISISPTGNVLEFNPAAERLFQLPAEEFLGRNISRIMPAPHRDEHDGYLRRYLATGERHIIGTNREVEAQRLDGTLFPAELAVTEVRFGDEHFYTCIIRDISARKTRQRQLVEANEQLEAAQCKLRQKAEKLRLLAEQAAVLREAADAASRAKSEFLTNTSHELRTPLTAITGFAEVIVDESDQDDVRDLARTVLRNGRHLLRIINDILDFSAIEAGNANLHDEPFSPGETIDEVLCLLKPLAAQHDIVLNRFLGPDVPDRILSDPRRFRQVLLNLAANGIRYNCPGGSVSVRVAVDHSAKTPTLTVEVIDTGIGISPAQLPRLFQAFSLVDASLTRSHGGAGLGLAISHRLCRLLGGRLEVSSELGRGSTFRFVIPLRQAIDQIAESRPAAPPLIEPSTMLTGRRILIVDDSPTNVRLLERFVGRAGAETEAAVNGQEAVAAVAAALSGPHPYDAVLLDLQMPVMNGYDAARAIRQLGYEGPIIAVSAEAEAAAVQSSRDAGCDEHVTKPVQRRDLLDLLCRRLQEVS